MREHRSKTGVATEAQPAAVRLMQPIPNDRNSAGFSKRAVPGERGTWRFHRSCEAWATAEQSTRLLPCRSAPQRPFQVDLAPHADRANNSRPNDSAARPASQSPTTRSRQHANDRNSSSRYARNACALHQRDGVPHDRDSASRSSDAPPHTMHAAPRAQAAPGRRMTAAE